MSAHVGSNFIVRWSSENLSSTDYVAVELQRNGGAWSTLNSQYANTGSYSWPVTGSIGDIVIFRISDYQQPLDISATTNNVVIAKKKTSGFFFFFNKEYDYDKNYRT